MLVYLPDCVLFGCPPPRAGATSYRISLHVVSILSIPFICSLVCIHTKCFLPGTILGSRDPERSKRDKTSLPNVAGHFLAWDTILHLVSLPSVVFWEDLALHRGWGLWSVELGQCGVSSLGRSGHRQPISLSAVPKLLPGSGSERGFGRRDSLTLCAHAMRLAQAGPLVSPGKASCSVLLPRAAQSCRCSSELRVGL